MGENILFSIQDGVALLTVNRPQVRNALDRATRREMVAALDQVESDDKIRVLVLAGAGEKSFIAGSDLSELAGYSPLQMEHFMATLAQRFYTRFEQLDKPVIAMIDGLCLGAGLELALACDLRLASDRSRFGLPEIKLGIMPGGGGTQRLPRAIGLARAKEMIFTGALWPADQALAAGLLNRVCPPEQLQEQVMALAQEMCELSPLALKWAKRSLGASQETNLGAGLDYEAMVECLLFSSQDRAQGMEAFLNKRKPRFSGR